MATNLTFIPSEIIVDIFCKLPGFGDVIFFANTCTRLRYVWVTHAATIYKRVAPKYITFEEHARRFHARTAGENQVMSPEDVMSIVTAAEKVDEAVWVFEWQFVSRYHYRELSQYFHTSRSFAPAERLRLSATERARFVRGYFLLWTMLRLEEDSWEDNFSNMTLKHLCLLHELCYLCMPVGDEDVSEMEAPRLSAGRLLWSYQGTVKRQSLRRKVNVYMETFQQNLGREPSLFVGNLSDVKNYGKFWFLVIWDHWKEAHREACLGLEHLGDRKHDIEFEKRYLWEDSSEEEG